jgi:transmembrane sensor
MSEPELTSSSDRIEQEAGAWLERLDFGLSAEERTAFEGWLAACVTHRVAFVRLRAAWDRTERLAALRTPMRPEPAVQTKKTWPRLLRHAVPLGGLAAAGIFAIVSFSGSGQTIYATAVGDREIITLADGSHVELNTDSVLKADITAAHRIVTLAKGEAYLDVKHDSGRPFVVNAGAYRITDLGTKFVVRAKPGRLEVSLVEGKARVEATHPAAGTSPVVLKPGEMAIGHDERIALVEKGEHLIAESLGWRRGVLVFDNTPLASAAAELNRYNRRQLVITDPSIAKLKVVGTFPATDLELVLAAAEDVYGLRVTYEGNTIRIHR